MFPRIARMSQGMLIVPRDKENQEYYRASEIQATDILSGAAGLDVLGRHEEIGRLHRMLDKASGGEAEGPGLPLLCALERAIRSTVGVHSRRVRCARWLTHARVSPASALQACGGNGRPERYETAEMRGTPF